MSAFCFIVKHLAVMNRFVVVLQMHDYVFQLSSVRRVVHPPPYHLKNYQVSNLPASCILDSYLVFWTAQFSRTGRGDQGGSAVILRVGPLSF